tara:strand:- start:332 stop:1042 length:711 start_codon:yes stop_codon:yes gene_type:complete
MILLRKIAIIFFDIIDLYYHQKKILKFIKKKQLNLKYFFDIGAHMGTYSDLILRNFENCKILMFEPQKNIFKKIQIKYKNKKNIKIYNYAISDKSTFKNIYINRHGLTSSLSTLDLKNNKYLQLKARLFGTTGPGMILKKTKVKTRTLNKIIKSRKIDLVKIDTEGHELEVLKGMKKSIKNIQCILVEFHNDEIYLSYEPEKIHNYLIDHNFSLKTAFKFPFTTWEDRFYFNNRFK